MPSPPKSGLLHPGASSGIYCLVLWVPRGCRITVAGSADCRFPPGWYVYTGSAKRNLLPRLTRHLRHSKTLHWHIDRLRPFARISEIWVRPWAPGRECETSATLRRLPKANIPCRGFGASDCRCDAHLVRLPDRPSPPEPGWALRFEVRGARRLSLGQGGSDTAGCDPVSEAGSRRRGKSPAADSAGGV